MPGLDHTGPDGAGPRTGRKLGKCRRPENEKGEEGTLGIGEAKRRQSGGGPGNGKRLKYYESKKKNKK